MPLNGDATKQPMRPRRSVQSWATALSRSPARTGGWKIKCKSIHQNIGTASLVGVPPIRNPRLAAVAATCGGNLRGTCTAHGFDPKSRAGLGGPMTESVVAQRKPRRKWGWIFVVLFVLQAIVFTAIIGTNMSEIDRIRPSSAGIRRNLDDSTLFLSRIEQLRSENRVMAVLAVFVSIGTLTFALVGLRRRK